MNTTVTAPSTTTPITGFAEHLLTKNILDENTIRDALTESAKTQTPFITHLVQASHIEAPTAATFAAEYFNLPLFDLTTVDRDKIPSNLLNTTLVQTNQGLPLFIENDQITVAVADPTTPYVSNISFMTGQNVSLVIVDAKALTHLIDQLSTSHAMHSLDGLSGSELDDIDTTQDDAIDDDEDPNLDNAPIVKYINKVLLDAIRQGASDIHFEPYEQQYRIRFRCDGILYEKLTPPNKLANYLVSRLKVMANLDISERRIPQDGRFKLRLSKHHSIDFRVSTCPMLWGEKVVMRILDATPELLNINGLGMNEKQHAAFLDNITRSQGIILVTGPTGSGKTISLYTALSHLNTPEQNISSVEDPIEINLPGINQVQVNNKAGLTFSAALRSFLRQDPDIVMVGEIRDLETAEIAIKAAQTGHLVLSTLHTNSAPETLVRLENMGIPAYNIASAIVLIVAQRLVRKLCDHCKQPEDLAKDALLKAGFAESELSDLTLYQPKGCNECHKGYKGRLGVFEVLPINDECRKLILSGANAIEIAELARKQGYLSLREAGLEKVRAGLTSLTEVNRIMKA